MKRILLAVFLVLALASWADAKTAIIGATGLTGGGTGALDAVECEDILGDNTNRAIATGDVALVTTSEYFYVYRYNAVGTDSESSPSTIVPDDRTANCAGAGQWELKNITALGITIGKSSGVAGYVGLYEANSTDTSMVGWLGAASIAETWWYQFSSTQPAAGQAMVFAAPTGSGGPDSTKTSAQTWILPLADPGSAERGDVFYTGASGTARLAPGTAGNPLITGGAGADPSWLGVVMAGGTNTFSLTNGTASLDIAAGATLNIDTSLAVSTAAITLVGKSGGSSLTLPTALSLDGTLTNTYLCKYTAAGTIISCDVDPATYATAGQQFYIGTTQVAINRTSAALTLAGITLTTPDIGAATGTTLALGADPADAGAIRLANGAAIAWEDATEASITHVDNTGWLINSTHQLQFGDSGTYINQAADGVMQVATDTELRLLVNDEDLKLTKTGANGITIGTNTSVSTITSALIFNHPLQATEVDGHTDQTSLTAANVSGTVIYNTGQGAADVFLLLPTAAAGYSFVATVGTAQANHFGVEAGADDKIYLLASAGTIAAGDNNAAVVMTAAQVGQSFACWTFKTDAYDWMCKAISIGTSTFAAHAHSTP